MNISNGTNTTGTKEENLNELEMVQVYFFLVYYVILLVMTVGGNTLVCLAIYLDRRLRSSTNWFVASLAVADLLYGLVGLPFRIAQTSGTVFELHQCYTWIWADMVCAAASIANLALISVDRYLKITKPFQYHVLLTQPRTFIAVGGVWIYSAVLASLSLIRWPGALGVILHENACLNINQVFYTVANIVAFILPLVILVMNYVKVFVEALKQFNKMKEMTTLKCKEEKRKHNSIIRDFKATKTLAVVIGTFTICWCPFFFLFTFLQYNPTFLVRLPYPWNYTVISVFFNILPNLNSALNPFIYAYFNNDFRRAFRKIVTRSFNEPMTSHYEHSGDSTGHNSRRRSSVLSYFLLAKHPRHGRHSSQGQAFNNNSSDV
jgi:hypothetical protein